MADNAFIRVDDWVRAQELAGSRSPDPLHRPVSEAFGQSYHWSLMQVEYATDLAFRSVKESIYSLIDLREILLGCNRRYLTHLSALDDFSTGVRALGRVTQLREVDGWTVKGINFSAPGDGALLRAMQNPGSTSLASAAGPRVIKRVTAIT